MIKIGEYVSVKTKTLEDRFGEVVWRCDEMGLPNPFKDGTQGIKFTLIAGTGPSANPGRTIIDSEANVEKNFKSGIARKISKEQALALSTYLKNPENKANAFDVNY